MEEGTVTCLSLFRIAIASYANWALYGATTNIFYWQNNCRGYSTVYGERFVKLNNLATTFSGSYVIVMEMKSFTS